MIASLTGEITQIGATSAVVTLGGFGVRVLCTPQTTAGLRLGQTTTLATSLVVREDSLTLYGFGDTDERDCFELLQTASGVGPKLAQAAVSVLPPDDLRAAIATEDLAALCKVPGVGRKGAQRIVLELKDKVHALSAATAPAGATAAAPAWRQQVADGLQGLGWSARDAEAACDRVADSADDGASVAELMRAALRSLAR